MSGRSARTAIGAGGTLIVLLGEVGAYATGRSESGVILDLAIVLTYLYGGLLIWQREPASRTGPLMVLIGLTWQIGVLSGSSVPALSWIGIALGDTSSALLVLLVLAYPDGRFDTSFDRRAAILLAAGITVLDTLQVVPFPIWVNVNPNGFYVGIALAATAAFLIVRRWALAPPDVRSERAAVLVAGIVLVTTIVLNIIRRVVALPEPVDAFVVAIREIGPAAIPVALLVGFYRRNAMRYRALVDTQRETEAELRRSRARIVEATDAERRRLERDLHDGAQQRLVALSLALRLLKTQLTKGHDPAEAVGAVDQASEELKEALAELRELARGIHPAVLTEAGLGPAIAALADRSSVPAVVRSLPDRRFSQAVEATAYFVVSEALTNIAKHADAQSATIAADYANGTLTLIVNDDGKGGADNSGGSGLSGLRDRVASIGGTLTIHSPEGSGTTVTAALPAG
jgi:signal transduction histidine kinase